MKRISGINVQYDQGEARFGQVRGTSADMSSVTINGNRVPSAEGDTRNVQLDLIPADMIQTIEVNKVVTPDMDADAIGGSINLVTTLPYEAFHQCHCRTGYNWISDKAQLNLGARRRRSYSGFMRTVTSKNFSSVPSALPVTAKNFGSVLTTFRLLCATCSLKYILYGPVDSSSGNTG